MESRRAVASATPGPQILLAEDDAIIGQAITDYLESCGYSVTTAVDGADVLHQLESARPALILMDI